MGLNYLWDSNTVIYYLQRQLPRSSEDFLDRALRVSGPALSVITEIELLCWKTDQERDLSILHSFVRNSTILELEPSIKLQTIDLRKKTKIKLPDAIIAATALVYNLPLITRNTADFKSLDTLKLIDPFGV